MKMTGRLPMLGWEATLKGMAPWGTFPHHDLPGEELVSGHVTYGEYQACECPIRWETTMGPFWGRFKDEGLLEVLLSEQLEDRIYQNETVSVRTGDVVLDIGGHLGTFTRAALDQGARMVIAFEPEPVNAACFKRTFAAEMKLGRVVLIEAAAMERPGKLRFELQASDNSGMGKITAQGEVEVEAVTIDDTVERLALDSVDFIKMDIEGSERYALEGAARTLDRFAPRMSLCTYHREDDSTVLPQIVLGLRPSYKVVQHSAQAYFY